MKGTHNLTVVRGKKIFGSQDSCRCLEPLKKREEERREPSGHFPHQPALLATRLVPPVGQRAQAVRRRQGARGERHTGGSLMLVVVVSARDAGFLDRTLPASWCLPLLHLPPSWGMYGMPHAQGIQDTGCRASEADKTFPGPSAVFYQIADQPDMPNWPHSSFDGMCDILSLSLWF